jgi:hypothetical protein
MHPLPATARAAVFLISGLPAATLGAPPTCADVMKKIEKKLLDAGGQPVQLKIVPKGLSAGSQVLASCENGTQHIVRPASAAASAPGGRRPDKGEAARTKR